jgi:hypothetical protein
MEFVCAHCLSRFGGGVLFEGWLFVVVTSMQHTLVVCVEVEIATFVVENELVVDEQLNKSNTSKHSREGPETVLVTIVINCSQVKASEYHLPTLTLIHDVLYGEKLVPKLMTRKYNCFVSM